MKYGMGRTRPQLKTANQLHFAKITAAIRAGGLDIGVDALRFTQLENAGITEHQRSMGGDVLAVDIVEHAELKNETGMDAVAVDNVKPNHARMEEAFKVLSLIPTPVAAQALAEPLEWI